MMAHREKEKCLCLQTTLSQVSGKVKLFTALLKAGNVFISSSLPSYHFSSKSVSVFISQVVILSSALLSLVSELMCLLEKLVQSVFIQSLHRLLFNLCFYRFPLKHFQSITRPNKVQTTTYTTSTEPEPCLKKI